MVRSRLPSSLLVIITMVFVHAGCGGAQHSGGAESTAAEEQTHSEALPIPGGDYEESGAASDVAATDDAEPGPPPLECELAADDPATAQQVSTFTRWLRDQSVGRHVTVDDLAALCGDQGGFLVVEVYLSGPAGGLDSLGRALPLYYPGSTWNVTAYERLQGTGVPLRVTIEARIPTGGSPRPRCTWDDSVPCP